MFMDGGPINNIEFVREYFIDDEGTRNGIKEIT